MGRRKGPALDSASVVAAAVACVEADGPDALGVSRVARALGIKPPSLYNHVGKGDALARAVVIEGNRRLLVALTDAATDMADPRDRLLALALATRDWARANASLYTVMSRVQPDNEHPEFAAVLQDTLALFAEPLTSLGVVGEDTIHAIRGLRAAMHGFLLLENAGQFALAANSSESFVWLVQAVLRGLPRFTDS